MNKFLQIFIFSIVIFVNFAQAQSFMGKNKIKVPPPVCYASEEIERIYVPPPREILLKSGEGKKSEINVNYSLFPQDAIEAFDYAVTIWEHIIESDIPILIEANWRTQDKNVLGSCGPSDYFSNFENSPRKDYFYPIALAEKISKSHINPTSSPDIVATFNKTIDWYFRNDGKTPIERYDFVTVVLHEIGHGLGFTGFFFVSGEQGVYGNNEIGEAAAFDLLVMNNKNQLLTDKQIFEVPSVKLYEEFTSGFLYANSPVAIANNRDNKPKLYAPSTWNDGSSIYHLNDATYPPDGTGNSLMTHAIGKGEAVHDPGPITRGLMADIGWKHMFLEIYKPKDIEQVKPINFYLAIESNFQLDTNAVFVYYSIGDFENEIDSVPLIFNPEQNQFTAQITPAPNAEKLSYFISATDSLNRIFRLPTEAPLETWSVRIGPDNESPTIVHNLIPYFILNNENLFVSANIDDNLGIDTAYIEYSINGEPQIPFGLTPDLKTNYSGFFNFDLNSLNDGDEISYKIVAIDSSVAKNIKRLPVKGGNLFKIEKIFEPIASYFNDFNNVTPDFIVSDFEIYTAVGFDNGALHSPHPYPSPNNNNANLNFSTLLKYPVILQENATMSFDEIVLVESGEILSKFGDDDFYDYVIIEGSNDNGKTWLPLANGYDSGDNSNWKVQYNLNVTDQVSETVGNKEWFITREINMLQNGNFFPGDTILVQFRLFSDPYAHGWGWAIDNLRIQRPVSTPVTLLSPGNIMVYPNPFNDIVTVSVSTNNKVGNISIEVFNLYGQKIKSVHGKNVFGEFPQNLDLSDFANGMYLLTVIENGKRVFSKKIIKK